MEIGGGYGGLVFWLYKLGFRNITLYDLPEMNIIQEYYLSKALPEAKIYLYSEVEPDKDAEIKILPYYSLDKIKSKKYDIAINQDSLPEIPELIALHYLKEIKRTTKHCFFSVNQETGAPNRKIGLQGSVPKLTDKSGGFKRKTRSLFWCRIGYVLENYSIT